MLSLIALAWLRWSPHPWLQPLEWVAALFAVGAAVLLLAFDPARDSGEVAAATPLVPGSMQLAWRYRPRLFFDSKEQFFPMDIG